MREILKKVHDRKSRFYGWTVLNTDCPEYPETLYFADRRTRTIYINKGAREGASVVRVS